MLWTSEDEKRIQDAVDNYKQIYREEKLDAEIQRRIFKLRYGRMAGLCRFLSLINPENDQ